MEQSVCTWCDYHTGYISWDTDNVADPDSKLVAEAKSEFGLKVFDPDSVPTFNHKFIWFSELYF